MKNTRNKTRIKSLAAKLKKMPVRALLQDRELAKAIRLAKQKPPWSEIWGAWPGDEPIEELLAELKEV